MPRTVLPHLPSDALSRRDQPVLIGDGLVLRPWAARDAPAVHAAFAAPDIQHWHLRSIADLDEARAWVSAWAQRWQLGSDASWAITTADPGGPADDRGLAVGYVALREIDLAAGSAEVSYWVTPAARGHHLAALAVDVLARWVFTDLGLHRLWIMHSTRNGASCAAAVRAGFAAEGTSREHLRHADGWHDMHVHGRLTSDRRPAGQ